MCIATVSQMNASPARAASMRMPDDNDFDAMVDACRQAHEAVMEHGTAEMQAFTKALLHALAKEAARRAKVGADGHDA